LASESVFNNESFNLKAAPQLMRVEEQKALEKTNLANALKYCQGKIYGDNGAAKVLGLKPTTLASKLKKYHLNRQDFIN
jgi:transcriptional regulator with GAF, ATPase, and Fis domain